MKRTLTIVLVITLAIVACSRKVTPTTTKTEQTQPATADDATVAAGKTLYINRCGTCHGLKKVENYSVDQWARIMRSMAPKAKLTDAETQQVTAYVNANSKK